MQLLHITFFLVIISYTFGPHSCGETNDATKKFRLIQYFRASHLTCRNPSPELLNSYSEDIYKKMDTVGINSRQEHSQDLIAEINLSIYEDELEKLRKTSSQRDEDQAMLNALNLMLPKCLKSYVLEAVQDLSIFYSDDPNLGGELLARIRNRLKEKKLTTKVLLSLLDSYQNQWIPLGRLQNLLSV